MTEDRKKIWVNQFQTKLFLRITVYWLIYQVSVWNFLFLWQVLQEGASDPLAQYWQFLQGYLPTLILFVSLVPILAWDAVCFAHRMVGPVVRFRRALADLIAGKPVRRIKLRQGDFLVDLQNDFNQMLETLESRGVSVLHPADQLPSTKDEAVNQ